jgi:hypothetical protein
MVDPSSSKEIAIAILPKFSGFFSILGSGFIILSWSAVQDSVDLRQCLGLDPAAVLESEKH